MAKHCRAQLYNSKIQREREIILNNNLAQFYKYVNRSLSGRSGIGSLKDASGTLIADDHARANLLNEFFCSDGVVNDGVSPPFTARICDDKSRLSEVRFTPQLVYKQLRFLKPNTAAGPDRLGSDLLRKLAPVVCKPLAKIFELSFSSGSLPLIWKRATVTPVFKGGISSDPNNYRPISLTCVCCKVMESIIKDQLLTFLLTHNLDHTAAAWLFGKTFHCDQSFREFK